MTTALDIGRRRGAPNARRGLRGAATLLAILLALPVVVVVAHVLAPWGPTWGHLIDTTLSTTVLNTLWLMVGVGVGVVIVGTGTAWLVTVCGFPGRALFEWALMLPLAVPAYVIAYTYTDLLQFAGPVQGALRAMTGWEHRDYWFPPVRSLGGAIAMFVLVLYPYVYLIARASFLQQSVCVLDASRMLGLGPWRGFVRVALPLARPAIAAGTALALMETVSDFGTVSYFGVQTFTTGIYKTWFSLGDRTTACQLAALLLLVVLAILGLERASRGRRQFDHATRLYRPLRPHRLAGWRAAGAWLACALPVGLGFILPAAVLLRMALLDGDAEFGLRFIRLAANSFILAGTAALLAVGAALVLALAGRVRAGRVATAASKVAGLGYAVPGSVIAVGLLVPLAAFDNALDGWTRATLGVSIGLLLTGSIAALVFAYVVRFLAVALHAIDAGFTRVSPSMDGAGRSLGAGPWGVLARIHLPLIRGSALGAALLVFVDVLKELPATLIMRPFNFDTLAVRAHNLAADERLSEASTAALTIVVVGLAPLLALSRAIARSRPGRAPAHP
ncbi:MAG: iron ABC transporter permease [Alphaproteobacteria bacterium]